jgi:hypothetical protein
MKKYNFNRIAKFIYYGLTTLGIFIYFASKANAQTNPLQSTFSRLTINTAAPFTKGFNTPIPAQAQSLFGGLTNVSCRAGESPASCVPMGFFDTAFGTGSFTPQSAAAAAGKSLDPNRSLAEVTPWLGKITVKDALAADLNLGSLLPNYAVTNGNKLAPGIANAPFGSVVDLRSAKLANVPSLANTPLNKFQGFQKLTASQIPNVGKIAFANMPTYTVPAGGAILKMDLVRNKERKIENMVLSGSEEDPNAKCETNCDYIETHPIVGLPLLKGAKIISGDSLQVRGGKGLLKWVNGGKEPTGISASGVKLVVRNVNARKGTASVNVNLRFCYYYFGQHCTPYFIGFPLWELNEKYNTIPLITDSGSVRRIIKIRR